MADDTGTDWAAPEQLAAWLEGQAEDVRALDEIALAARENRLRAAAVGLRRLAQLDTAIGNPNRLRIVFDPPYKHAALSEYLHRIADAAVLGSGEQPERAEP